MDAAVPSLNLAPVPSWLGLLGCLPTGSEPRPGELEQEPVVTGFGAHAHVLLSPRMMTNAGLGPGDWVALAVRGEIPGGGNLVSLRDDSVNVRCSLTSALLAQTVTLDTVPEHDPNDDTNTIGSHVVLARAHPNAKASSPTAVALARKTWMSLGRPTAGDVVLVCPLDVSGSNKNKNESVIISSPSPGETSDTTTLRLWALEGDSPSVGSGGDWLARGLASSQTQSKNEYGSRQLSVLESLARRALDGRCLLRGNLVRLPLLGASAYFKVEHAERGVVDAATSVKLLGRTDESRDEKTKAKTNADEIDDSEDEDGDSDDPGAAAARRAERAGRRFASASDATGGYASLGGVDQHVASLKELVELPLRKPELFERCGVRPPRGVLLWGPPGTGKTRLARAAAAEAGASLLVVRGPELVTAAVGESERALRGVFEQAAKQAPCVVLLDELDAIAPARSGGDGLGGRGDAGENGGDEQMSARVVAALLSVLDGADESTLHRVVVVATTNRPDAIDRALRRPGRFDREIELDVPTPSARLEILQTHLRRIKHEMTDAQVEALAKSAHGFVGADVAALCAGAAMQALRRRVVEREHPTRTSPDDLQSSLAHVSIDTKEHAQPCVGTPEKQSVTYFDFLAARRRVKPSGLRELSVEYPRVAWDDVGGLSDVKQRLKEAVEWSEVHGESMKRVGAVPPAGTLLYGPPGCSKTMLARAVASASGRNFVTVKGPELHSKYVGESEKAVRALFTRARQSAPSVIFLDELDGLVGARGGGGGGGPSANDRVLTQLLREMDGLSSGGGGKSSVAVIAATNRPDLVDKALLRPGRFDRLLFVPPPDRWEDRWEIITRRAWKTPLASDVDLKLLALSTQGYTGADLNALVREAAMAALEESLEAKEVNARHFATAALRVKASPAPTKELSEIYENFQRGGS